MQSQSIVQKQRKYIKISKNRWPKKKSKKYNTWSSGATKWYGDTGTGMGTLPTNFAIKNQAILQDALGVGTGHNRLFRARGMVDELHIASDGSIFDNMLKSVPSSFYTIGDLMEPVQHRISSADGSATEYEELEEGSDQEVPHHNITSKRHTRDLHQVWPLLFIFILGLSLRYSRCSICKLCPETIKLMMSGRSGCCYRNQVL